MKGKKELTALLQDSKLNEEKPIQPILRRFKTEDGTVEKIGEILVQNPQGILVHRDELTGWLKSLDRYGREGDRSFYLESWNGNGSFTVDRIGRGTIHIPALCLSVFGGIQPGPLRSYVYQATTGEGGDDGFLQRFQIAVWPDAPKKWINVDRWPNTQAKNRAYMTLESLANISLPHHQGEEVTAIRFDFGAQQVFNEWRDVLEERLRKGDLHPAFESHLAKYRSLMPSIALILYLVDAMDQNAPITAVTEKYALKAAAWCEYLESHAQRLYSSAQDPSMESARELLKHFKKRDVKDSFSPRDIYRNQWSKLTKSEEAKKAIEILCDYGWIKSLDNNARSIKYKLHPQLRRDDSHE